MKKQLLKYAFLILLCLSCLGIPEIHGQKQTACPRNLSGKAFTEMASEIKKHNGETVAFDAEVIEIQKGYNDKPYVKASFQTGETVWISSLISDKNIAVGSRYRMLGYINQVKSDDAIGQQYNKNGIHILTFAMLDLKTKQLQMSDAFETEANEWIAGKIPNKMQ